MVATSRNYENPRCYLQIKQKGYMLKDEIKKYGLKDVILINHKDYLIVGLGDLETLFNDYCLIAKMRIHLKDKVKKFK